MLVLTRRENESVDFPALGISVEVLSSTRARVSLGIRAPRELRVIRHELTSESETFRDDSALAQTARQHAAKEICQQLDDQMKTASERLERVQAQLRRGDCEQSMRELTATLADIDAIRASLKTKHLATTSAVSTFKDAERWPKSEEAVSAEPGSVSESATAYEVSPVRQSHIAPDRRRSLSRPSRMRGIDWSVGSAPSPWFSTT